MGKSSKKKRVKPAAASPRVSPARARAAEARDFSPTVWSDLSPRAWWIAALSILAVAALLRFWDLNLKPLHHDEGVNGFFLTNLYRKGQYTYDPENYHGPTLYYFSLVVASTKALLTGQSAGLSTFGLRFVTVFSGVGTVWLALCLRRYIGAIGALAAAALIAVSPGAVFFSRYYIHESLVVFFTLGLVVAALKYYESEREPNPKWWWLGAVSAACALTLVAVTLNAASGPGAFKFKLVLIFALAVATDLTLRYYDGPRVTYLLLAVISAALLFATKETAFITIGVFAIALVSTDLYFWLRPRLFGSGRHLVRGFFGAQERLGGFRLLAFAALAELVLLVVLALAGRSLVGPFLILLGLTVWATFLGARKPLARVWPVALVAIAVFIFVNVLFYSSFFTNSKGVLDSLRAFQFWSQTSEKAHVFPSKWTYLTWLWREEAPILILGAAGIVLAAWRAANRFVLFAALWAFGIIAAYTLIPYKTPWLALNFIIPLAIVGGIAIEELYRFGSQLSTRLMALGFAAVAIVVLTAQSISLNFVHYDAQVIKDGVTRYETDSYPYVYAHTTRELVPLLAEIDRAVARAGTGLDTQITIVSPDYWPLPWYLRDYKHADFFGQMVQTNAPIVIASASQVAELESTLGATHVARPAYALRPGVLLTLFIRRDLAQ